MSQNNFSEQIQKLLNFYNAIGRLPTEKEDLRLHRWMAVVRGKRKYGELLKSEEACLDEIGFIWDAKLAKKQERESLRLEKNLSELLEFLGVHKRLPTFLESSHLYGWMSSLRVMKRKGALPNDIESKLDSIGFSWNKNADNWDARMNELVTLVESSGMKGLVNHSKLYSWYKNQEYLLDEETPESHRKTVFNNFFTSILAKGDSTGNTELNSSSTGRIEVTLKTIPFSDIKQIAMLGRLSEFHKTKGYWPKSGAVEEDERKLGIWCQSLRRRYKLDSLAPFWLDELRAIDFSFNGKADTWMKNFETLKQFVTENKKLFNPKHVLYNWMRLQISGFKRLSEDKRTLLEAMHVLEFWQGRKVDWNHNLHKVKAFLEQTGKLPTKRTAPKLNAWIAAQKRKFKINLLSKQEIKELRRLGVLLSMAHSKELKWEANYKQLIGFRASNPQRWPGYYGQVNERFLYHWCQAQRQLKAGTAGRKRLEQDRIDKLNSIGFFWTLDDIKESLWSQKYKALQAYVEENGTSSIPTKINGKGDLKAWLRRQQISFKNGALSEEKTEKLKSIGMPGFG